MALTGQGYARTDFSGMGKVRVHRVSYEYYRGPIPDGLVIDHLCGNKACVNPDHLEPVTSGTNTKRHFAALETCKNGHPRTPETTRKNGKWITCKVCERERIQERESA